MKNFIKGALALWTVLTTIWTFITFDIIRGMIEGFGERDNQIQKQDDQYCMWVIMTKQFKELRLRVKSGSFLFYIF
jgi:hypothetical protein